MPEYNEPGAFLENLRERQVIKAFVLYVAIGWGFYEIASEVLTRFGFAQSLIQLLLVFLLLGLPAVLFLAWYFDVDRRGIREEAKMQRRDWLIVTAALLLPIVGVIVAKPFVTEPAVRFEATDNSAAILPFTNLTGDPMLEYLADGVAEEIISRLTALQALDVSAMSQSFRYRDANIEARAIGSELGAAYVVRGSVRRSGQLLRFSANIVETGTGRNVWSDNAEVNQTNVFSGQDQLSEAVAQALASEMGIEINPAGPVQPPDPEAYDLYLRGRHIWHRRGTVDLEPGVNMLAEAVKVDPDFAKGWSALASAYLTYPSYSRKGGATWNLGEEAALKAIELDPRLPEPYAALGAYAQTRQEWIDASRFYVEALRLDDKNATAHYWYGEHLAAAGRYADSLRHMREAVRLDPTYQPPKSDIAFSYLTFGAHEMGARAFQDSWAAGYKSIMNWLGNFIGYVVLAEYETASEWVAASPLNDSAKALLARFVAAEAGQADDELVEDLLNTPDARLDHRIQIWMLARLGNLDAAMSYAYQRAENQYLVDPRALWGIGIRLHDHERFPDLLELLGLTNYWQNVAWGDVCREENGEVICDRYRLSPEILGEILAER